MIRVQYEPIQIEDVVEAVKNPAAGAIITFQGVTRNHFHGKVVVQLEYEAYQTMAEAEMSKIAAAIEARWPGARVAMVHRLGIVPIQECSVVIAVSAPHRDAAYLASREAIERLKDTVPIWKKEIYEDGSQWKANA